MTYFLWKKKSEIVPSSGSRVKASINKDLMMGYTEYKLRNQASRPEITEDEDKEH